MVDPLLLVLFRSPPTQTASYLDFLVWNEKGKQFCVLFDVFVPSLSPLLYSSLPLFYFASIGAIATTTDSTSDEFLLSPSE